MQTQTCWRKNPLKREKKRKRELSHLMHQVFWNKRWISSLYLHHMSGKSSSHKWGETFLRLETKQQNSSLGYKSQASCQFNDVQSHICNHISIGPHTVWSYTRGWGYPGLGHPSILSTQNPSFVTTVTVLTTRCTFSSWALKSWQDNIWAWPIEIQ